MSKMVKTTATMRIKRGSGAIPATPLLYVGVVMVATVVFTEGMTA